MKPAASRCLTASENRVTVSLTEYLLDLVIRPSSAACATPPQIASETTKLVRFFLKVINFATCYRFHRAVSHVGSEAGSASKVAGVDGRSSLDTRRLTNRTCPWVTAP